MYSYLTNPSMLDRPSECLILTTWFSHKKVSVKISNMNYITSKHYKIALQNYNSYCSLTLIIVIYLNPFIVSVQIKQFTSVDLFDIILLSITLPITPA